MKTDLKLAGQRTAHSKNIVSKMTNKRLNGFSVLSAWNEPNHDTHDQMLLQVRFIKCKLRALKDLVQMYEETNSIDINLLDEENCFRAKTFQKLQCDLVQVARWSFLKVYWRQSIII
ncbi:hypothetical protein PRIC1_000736 [Phytophthora ramorum]